MNQMDSEFTREIVARFKEISILVIGDLMLDEYIWGEVNRISPEAPVPVLCASKEEKTLGGAGNVASNLQALGARVFVAGVVGNDWAGDEIIRKLKNLEVEAGGIFMEAGRPSTVKTRLISADRNQHLLRLDRETKHAIAPDTLAKLLSYAEELFENQHISAVILSDYVKGAITPELSQAIIRMARTKGIPVVIDPKEKYLLRDKYKGATCITPNVREAEQLANREIQSEDELMAVGQWLRADLNLACVLITRGAAGMIGVTQDMTFSVPAKKRVFYDVTGAGDTAIAVFTLAVACGASYELAARLANHAGGLVVSKLGTATISPAELLLTVNGSEPNRKILDLPELLTQVEQLKAEGKEIVFTNGCFDLLHAGHVTYLEAARALGDILIVGLNSDDSVRRIKGNGRPILPEGQRAQVLAALEFVDFVVLFYDDTPHELISALLPHVLVKGRDYSFEDVVGKDVVEAFGGRVELIDLVENTSTSHIVERIKEKR